MITMDYVTYSKKLAVVKEYIKNGWANTPCTLAKKLDISERTIFRMIAHLKDTGINIEYNKSDKTYHIYPPPLMKMWMNDSKKYIFYTANLWQARILIL